MKKVCVVLTVFIPFARPALAYRGEVENVPPRTYFQVAQREIDGAKSSISLYLYLFTLQPNESQSEVFKLAQSLKRARDRGVKVEVVLDQNVDYTGEEGAPVTAKNRTAYAFLKKSGIPVFYDDAATYTHAKALIVDEQTALVGSSNWSRSAFDLNAEANVLIRSKETARDLLKTLRAIPREEPADEGPVVPIPLEFLINDALFGRMLRQPDERSFDVYLYLAREDYRKPKGNQTISLNYETLAEHLGIKSMDREAYRRQINKVLMKLQNRYQAIRVAKAFNAEADIDFLRTPSQNVVPVPAAYWEWGWNRRLSFAGKAFYLINRRESADLPEWSSALETLAKRYGASPWFISQGVTNLRRNNLMEVEYDALSPNGEGPRAPNVYTLNPLYDPQELDRKLENLKQEYGAPKVERAQRAAAVVYEDRYWQGIKRLMELEDRYGADQIERAVKIVEAKNPDNPRRTIGYLIRTIQNLTPVPK